MRRVVVAVALLALGLAVVLTSVRLGAVRGRGLDAGPAPPARSVPAGTEDRPAPPPLPRTGAPTQRSASPVDMAAAEEPGAESPSRDLGTHEVGVLVTDTAARSLAGLPVRIWRVDNNFRRTTLLASGVSDERGEFIRWLKPDDRPVADALLGWGEAEVDGTSKGLCVESGSLEPGTWTELELGPGTPITVRLRSATGGAVEGWQIVMCDPGSFDLGSFDAPTRQLSITDASGLARFPGTGFNPGDDFCLVVRWPGDPHAVTIVRQSMGERAPHRMGLTLPPLGTLEVVAEAGWSGERDYVIRRFFQELEQADEEGPMGNDQRTVLATATPEQPDLRVERLPAGRYHLRVLDSGNLRRDFPFHLAAGETEIVRIPALCGAMQLKVGDHNGQPLPAGTRLELTGPPSADGGEPVQGWLVVGKDGVVQLPRLPAGVWTLGLREFRAVRRGVEAWVRTGTKVTFRVAAGETRRDVQLRKPAADPFGYGDLGK